MKKIHYCLAWKQSVVDMTSVCAVMLAVFRVRACTTSTATVHD